MLTQVKKKRTHVSVRLDAHVTERLAQKQQAEGCNFQGPLIDRLLMDRLTRGGRPLICRASPVSRPLTDLWISAATAGLLKVWKSEADVTTGDMIFTLLSEELSNPEALSK